LEAKVAANPKATALGLPKKLPVENDQAHLLPQRNKRLQRLPLTKMKKKPENYLKKVTILLGWAIWNALFICQGG
jgi:hypothetical protein